MSVNKRMWENGVKSRFRIFVKEKERKNVGKVEVEMSQGRVRGKSEGGGRESKNKNKNKETKIKKIIARGHRSGHRDDLLWHQSPYPHWAS